MILSDQSIRSLIGSGQLSVAPYEPDLVQPGSLDCRLGNHFLVACDQNRHGDAPLRLDQPMSYREIRSQHVTMQPRTFLLATTVQYIRLPPHLSAFVEGRSSIGRMGLFIQNAGWVDAGFEGTITLELFNANSLPIRLDANRRICQLVFCQMDQPAQAPYRGKYMKQDQTVGSRMFDDDDIAMSCG